MSLSSSSLSRDAVFATVFLLCCAAVSNTHAASLSDRESADQTTFTFDDIFNPAFQTKSFSGSWINGTHFLYRNDVGNINYFNAENQEETLFVDNAVFIEINSYTYFVSADLQFVLFAYNRTKLWRHSYNAQYAAYNVNNRTWSFLPSGGTVQANKTLQYCYWSPSGHSLAFVYENDLYYQSSPVATAQRITTTGDPLYIFNGVPDWVYEEDVLSSRVTHYWSPTSQFIVYAELNDTEVPLQSWPWYGSKSQVYPRVIQIAYPKAGDLKENGEKAGPIPYARLFVVNTTDENLETATKKQLLPPTQLRDADHYFVQVKWRNNETVMVTWTNRVQNQHFTYIYDATNSNDALDGQLNYHQTVTNGWLETPPVDPLFVNGGNDYVTVLSHDVTDGDSWLNLARVSAPDNEEGQVTFLMKDAQEVQYIVGHDSSQGFVYFVSTNGNPLERHIMKLNVDGSESQTPECLTCDQPESCRYMSGSFSPDGADYYFLNCHGPDVPNYSLLKSDGAIVKMMENNSELTANLNRKRLPTRQFINITVGGYLSQAEIYWPPGHVEGSDSKYPLLVYSYAGPGFQRVNKLFPMGRSVSNWLKYMGSQHNVAVASIDGRGSMAAGDKKRFEVYRKLTTYEVHDQIGGGKIIRDMNNIDSSVPSAIFGWSYGGVVAAHAIGNESDTFTCGISVAPLAKNTFYDTAYVERYLGLATAGDNAAGYNDTDVTNKAANFVNKTYMIAHGTADDNVHFMSTVHMIRALTEAGVQFRQYLYADEAHSITTLSQARHLFAAMTNLLVKDCWPTILTPTPAPTVSGAAATSALAGGFASLAAMCLTLVAGCHVRLYRD